MTELAAPTRPDPGSGWMYSVSYGVNLTVNILMKVALVLAIVFCVVMTVSALGQVIARMTDLFEFEESEEISRFCQCWLAMLGSAVALRQGRHLGVRFLVEKLPRGVYDKYFAPCIQLLMLAFFILITYYGWILCMKGESQFAPSLDIPMMYPYLCIPVGGALMALNVVSDMLQDRFPTPAGSTANIAATNADNVAEILEETVGTPLPEEPIFKTPEELAKEDKKC